MLYYSYADQLNPLSSVELRNGLFAAFDALGKRSRVLIVPPDFSRFHSRAGELTCLAGEYFGSALKDIIPALGTHRPMTTEEIATMFPGVAPALFRIHDWRNDCSTLGIVPGEFVRQQSNGAVDFDWPAQVNRMVVDGGYDCILSIGQVVPHEVIGMAGYNKNFFVGLGGQEGIGKSHFLGAAYGMERLMGRSENPVRGVLNYAAEKFLKHLPIIYIQSVIDARGGMCGLFVGDDGECFSRAARLSSAVNVSVLDNPIRKAVVYLDPAEYKSMWLGNKAIYRTRMALADGAELIILGQGVFQCGEDPAIDTTIRAYGYTGAERILSLMKTETALQENLGAAAHLIHGSSEGRFHITYCTDGLSLTEVESVNFHWADYAATAARYNPGALRNGMNTMPDGEEIFYISNPAKGLWAWRERFDAAAVVPTLQ
jgi:nickel-dependent lactate racemase